MLTLDDLKNKIEKNEYEVPMELRPVYPVMTDDISKNQFGEMEKVYDSELMKYDTLVSIKFFDFRRDFREAVENRLGKKLTDKQFSFIFSYVWDEGHSCGYEEIVNCSRELLNIIAEFLK